MGQAIDLSSQAVNINVLPTFNIGGLELYAGSTFHAGGGALLRGEPADQPVRQKPD